MDFSKKNFPGLRISSVDHSFSVSLFKDSVQSGIALFHSSLLHSVTGISKSITLAIFFAHGETSVSF